MKRSLILFALMAMFVLAASPQFEVASIKPVNSSIPPPGPLRTFQIVTNAGRLTARNASLKDLIEGAYGLENYQVNGGPAWTTSARFDVEAKAAATADRTQLLLMLRSLLADRSKLVVHRETKELSIYALVLIKDGSKLYPLTASEAQCWPACAGSPGKMNHLRQRDLPTLARYLTRLGSDRPVIDKTGLTGKFGIDLDMGKILAASEEGGVPTRQKMFEATANEMQDELGLKLVPAKTKIEILTIDRAERPSQN